MSACWRILFRPCTLYRAGSGKTYTMQPLPLRAAADMFALLADPQFADLSLWVSCFEIYGGKLYDLLNGRATSDIVQRAGIMGGILVCIVRCRVHVQSRCPTTTPFCTLSDAATSLMCSNAVKSGTICFISGTLQGVPVAFPRSDASPWAGGRGWRCARMAASACASSA